MDRTRLAAAVCCCCCLMCPAIAGAQPAPTESDDPSQAGAPLTMAAPSASSFWAPFSAVPGDVKRFFSGDTARTLAPAALTAMFAARWDHEGIEMALARLQPAGAFKAGNVGGGMYAQLGGAFAVYSLGRATDSKKVAAVGSDLLRSQILMQTMVQSSKFAARRSRPDDSDRFSLPSGHTAGAMATATVLQRHFGWKVGIPAYAAGIYVAASRMSANKHHMSDVIMGAAFGIAAARTVTVGSGSHRFEMGVAPANRGAAITFTKQ